MTTAFGRLVGGLFLLASSLGVGAGITIDVVAAGPSGAVTPITVNDPTDSGTTNPSACTSGEGDCTLRSAIAAFNGGSSDMTIDLPDPTTLTPSESTYQVVADFGTEDISNSGHTLTIDYTGAGLGGIEAICGETCPVNISVLTVEAGTTAIMSDLEISGGKSTSDGGGILNIGNLQLSGSTVTDNTAATSGGGIAQTGTVSSMVLTNDIIDNNSAVDDGGGVYADSGTVTVTGGIIGGTVVDTMEIAGNQAALGGGVMLTNGEGTFSGVTIGGSDTTQGNTASEEGGGVYLALADPSFTGDTTAHNVVTDGNGGGVYISSGTNSFTDETIEDNSAPLGNGGGVYVQGGTNTFSGGSVTGNSADTTGEDLGGGIEVTGGSNSFSGQTVSGNAAGIGGGFSYGGLGDTITNETISDNTATFGASGVYVGTSGLTITASTISGNTTPGTGGGGIVNDFCNALTLTNDTIADNTDTFSGSTAYPVGGYLGVDCGTSHLPAIGSTAWARVGGAQAHTSGPATAFLFDTVYGNTAVASGGGGNIEQADSSVITLAQTIVAGGTSGGSAANCFVGNPATFTSGGYNLIDDATCGTPAATDIIGKDPQLGPLANNGGPTETLLPADNSPEVGAVPDAVWVASGVGADQRGVARGAGANSSATIGAVEVGQNFNGYRMVANEGGIFDFGLLFSGSLANNHLNAPIVGIANAPGPAGYLMVGGDGGVFALGGASFFGSLGGQVLLSPIGAIAATPTEDGYWLIAQNGKIYPFGSVPALPALSLPPGAHIVGMASTNTGKGIWAVDQYGDVYAEGDAQYVGGLGGVHINAPIVGIAAAAAGQGYVLVASDGGVFNYGMGFYGAVPGSLKAGQHLVAPIVGIAVTHSGKGYWEVGADGGLFNYGDAPFLGSIYTAIPGRTLNGPIVGIQHLGAANPPG